MAAETLTIAKTEKVELVGSAETVELEPATKPTSTAKPPASRPPSLLELEAAKKIERAAVGSWHRAPGFAGAARGRMVRIRAWLKERGIELENARDAVKRGAVLPPQALETKKDEGLWYRRSK